VSAACTPPPVAGATDVAVTQSVDNAAPEYGATAVFTIEAANPGSTPASGVTVAVSIPNGLTYVHASGPGTYDPASHRWSVGTLPPNEARSLALTMRAGDVEIGDRTVRSYVYAATSDLTQSNNNAATTLHAVPARIAVHVVPDPGNPPFLDITDPSSATWTSTVVNANDPTLVVPDVDVWWTCDTVSQNPCPPNDALLFTNPNVPLTLLSSQLQVDTYILTATAVPKGPNYLHDAVFDYVMFTTVASG
jgi:uncharacterized repeat protein (TIGR01451 family)